MDIILDFKYSRNKTKMTMMKGINTYSNIWMIITIVVISVFQACEPEENYPRTRLFQPVLNEDLYSVENTIVVNLGNLKSATGYLVEVSRDSFETVDYSLEIDTNFVILNEETLGEELLWFTIYQVQVTAYADEDEYNSLPSFLGSVRTQKYPSNMHAPTFFDVLDTRAKVQWDPAGDPITHVKIFAENDLRLKTPLLTLPLTQEQIDTNMVIIQGLQPSTTYQIAIYSGDVLRGWEIYTTREALVSGPNVVNLTGIDSSVIVLRQRLAQVDDGSIIILEGGKTYMAAGFVFDKSISFISGYSFVPALPVIDCSSNFNLKEGSNVGYVTFRDIHITASDDGFNSRYVFNIDKSATLGELKFESCVIRTLRGICRMKEGAGTLESYTISNCQVDSIKDYGLLTVDVNVWQCNDILIEHSTISKTVAFIQSRNNSNTLKIDGCTINESPQTGRRMFRYREPGQDNVLNGITITNTIWGHAWDMANEGIYLIDAYDGLGNTTFILSNNYATSEFGFDVAGGKDALAGFPSVTYSGLVTDLWTDPYNAVFEIKDPGFAGKGDAGDPRWRVGL
jgi:hypothetical protein